MGTKRFHKHLTGIYLRHIMEKKNGFCAHNGYVLVLTLMYSREHGLHAHLWERTLLKAVLFTREYVNE